MPCLTNSRKSNKGNTKSKSNGIIKKRIRNWGQEKVAKTTKQNLMGAISLLEKQLDWGKDSNGIPSERQDGFFQVRYHSWIIMGCVLNTRFV